MTDTGEYIEEWICPYCMLVFDTEDELDEHMRLCPIGLEVKRMTEHVQQLSKESKESRLKDDLENFKTKIKVDIIENATMEELELFRKHPEALERRVELKMLEEAFKHPFVRENPQILQALRELGLREVTEDLRQGFCRICKQTLGNEQALLNHLKEQSSLGSLEHKAEYNYINMVLTQDWDRIKQYLETKKIEESQKQGLSKEQLSKLQKEAKKEELQRKQKEAFILYSLLRHKKK